MSDLKNIHDAIIDNPEFNLNATAKRDLRELCAWVDTYRKHGQEILAANNEENEQQAKRIAELEAACEMKDKRIDWTVADNAKKAMAIERLRGEIHTALVLLEHLIWVDKERNTCGTKAGDSTDVHALRKLRAALKEDK